MCLCSTDMLLLIMTLSRLRTVMSMRWTRQKEETGLTKPSNSVGPHKPMTPMVQAPGLQGLRRRHVEVHA